jgi:hypothetical protein
MNITALELDMLNKVAFNESCVANGGMSRDHSDTHGWTAEVVITAADKGVFTSLLKKGLVHHQGKGIDSSCGLTEAGFEMFQYVAKKKATA